MSEHYMIMHAELYRRRGGNVEFLVVKRSPEDGGFWQPITGTIEMDEPVLECLRREIQEETGITELLHISTEIERVNWRTEKYDGTDIVFAVEVAPHSQVKLSHEHTEYSWLPFDQAVRRLKYAGNKASMLKVSEFIETRSATGE